MTNSVGLLWINLSWKQPYIEKSVFIDRAVFYAAVPWKYRKDAECQKGSISRICFSKQHNTVNMHRAKYGNLSICIYIFLYCVVEMEIYMAWNGWPILKCFLCPLFSLEGGISFAYHSEIMLTTGGKLNSSLSIIQGDLIFNFMTSASADHCIKRGDSLFSPNIFDMHKLLQSLRLKIKISSEGMFTVRQRNKIIKHAPDQW